MSATRRPAVQQKTEVSSAVLLGQASGAQPLRLQAAGGVAGEAGSEAALARLNASIAGMKAAAIAPLLDRAVRALQGGDAVEGGKLAQDVLQHDELSGFGWYLLGVARERLGDFKSSIQAYEAALKLLPDQAEIASDIGRLALRLDMKEVAVKLFRHFMAHKPEDSDGPNNLAVALRDLGRHEEAIDVLKQAIASDPAYPLLWNTLGTVVSEQGEFDTAVTFFTEAIRLDRGFGKAWYNRANIELGLGLVDEALADCDRGLKSKLAPDEEAMMRLARALILLCLGRLGEGWDEYDARLRPALSGVSHFLVDRPKWTLDTDLAGKHMLLVGEQGLGDEVLFANIVPDVLEAIGPDGKLSISVEQRLVSLFERSFPTASIHAHSTLKVDTHLVRGVPGVDQGQIDVWAPLASPLRRFRRSAEAFPQRDRFLVPDPKRVAHWRRVLEQAPPGLKVGLLWKSMKLEGSRRLQFSPFHQWAAVLKTPGISFINLQYGDCSEELALAREHLGVEIWTPPGIDLKQDLDELAALSCALDLVLGFANATSNIAAACGANVWLITIPGAWVQCGAGRYPWYPQARVFNPPSFGAWDAVMAKVAEALAELHR